MLRLGLIGSGSIGRDHIDRITNALSGASITGLYDLFPESAEKAAKDFGLNAKIYATDDELINDPTIDAVLVCSRNDAHLAPILKSIKAGKCVFTEKPMTTTSEDSKKIVDAEIASGRRFVQVGFMRRYDPGYQMLKKMIDSGDIGAPLLGNCRHYTARPATNYFTTENVINDAFIHEIDILHYLFSDDYKSIEIKFARPNRLNQAKNLQDPQLAIVEMKSGALVTVELNMNSQYGYDIQCRVVGEKGIVCLPEVQSCQMRKEGQIIYNIHKDWTLRFVEAYKREMQAFINSVLNENRPAAPSAWDGYVASVTSDKALESQRTGKKVTIELEETPKFYVE